MTSVLVVALIAAVFVTFIALAVYRRKETFAGVVIDKDIIENVATSQPVNQSSRITFARSGVTHTFMVNVKTESGKNKNWQVSEGQYEIINIGDKVRKPAGTTMLEVISKANNQSSSTIEPAQNTPTRIDT